MKSKSLFINIIRK